MKKILLLSILILLSCNKTSKKEHHFETNSEISTNEDEKFSDGEYCAEIQYYNPNTGKHSTYTLPVEIENGELVKIQWENGGWLDESHFTAPDISDGTATFEDDREREYEVELKEKGSNCSSYYNNFEEESDNDDSSNSESEDNL